MNRIEELEKQQSLNVEKFKTKTKELRLSVSKQLEEANLDAAGKFNNISSNSILSKFKKKLHIYLCLGLRRLIHIKNKELKQMKVLASTILNQRTETEQFFLESLQEVLFFFISKLFVILI
jgi:hypothetical protein